MGLGVKEEADSKGKGGSWVRLGQKSHHFSVETGWVGTVPGGVRAAPGARVHADGPVRGQECCQQPSPSLPSPHRVGRLWHQAAHFLTTVPTKK